VPDVMWVAKSWDLEIEGSAWGEEAERHGCV